MPDDIDWSAYFAAKRSLDRARDRVAIIGQKQHLMQHDLDSLDGLLTQVDEAEAILRATEDRLRQRSAKGGRV